MDIYGLAIRRLFYPLWVRKNGSSRLRYLTDLRTSQYWSSDRIRDHQLARLKVVVRHAYERCDFYRAHFDASGFHPSQLLELTDMAKIPLVSKTDIQRNAAGFLARGVDSSQLIEDRTGGSTGSPLRFYYDNDRNDWREAAALRHDEWSGWRLGASKAVLWGATQDMRAPSTVNSWLRRKLVERYDILDASAVSDRSLEEFARRLQGRPPRLLLAYANTLRLFADYVSSNQITGINPGAIIASAEVLTSETRHAAESAFDCKVYNRYGCREFSVIASECGFGQGLHVNAENLYVEVLSDGQPVLGVEGDIVVTDLRNLAMPMIRYAIKDVGTLPSEVCGCGRGLPLLTMGAGRTTDFLISTAGAKVSGIVISTYVSTRVTGLRQMQIHQHQSDRVSVHYVPDSDWTVRSREELTLLLKQYLGTDMNVELVRVDVIPLEKSGKFRFSVVHAWN